MKSTGSRYEIALPRLVPLEEAAGSAVRAWFRDDVGGAEEQLFTGRVCSRTLPVPWLNDARGHLEVRP